MVNKFIPKTKAEALDIISKHDCYILAGGTDLMVVKKNVAGSLPSFDKDVLFISHLDELKGDRFAFICKAAKIGHSTHTRLCYQLIHRDFFDGLFLQQK